MGVDQSKVKQKAKEEADKAAQRGVGGFSYWTPKNGKNMLRFMPPWTEQGENANQFWREIYVHWNVGPDEETQQSFSCPKKTPFAPAGASCPICEFVEKLRKSDNPSDQEYAKDIRPKQQFYSNIVDLSDAVYKQEDVDSWLAAQDDKTRQCPFKAGDSKVQVYRYGSQVYKELLDIFSDTDISDLQNGHDVELTRETPDPKKPIETKYRLRAKFEKNAFKLVGRTLAEALPNLDRINPFQSTQEMLQAISDQPALPPPSNGQQMVSKAPQLPPVQTQPEPTAPPPCHKDGETVSDKDAECIGGTKDGQVYDKCPWFGECSEVKAANSQVLKPPSRRAAAKPPAQATAVDDLERDLRASLNK